MAATPSQLPQRRFKVLLKSCSNVLLLTGLIALGSYGFVVASTHLYQAHESRCFDQTRKEAPSLAISRQGRALSESADSVLRSRNLVGRLEIPRIGLEAIILEGDDPSTLRLAVGHIAGTALPGQWGNVGIAGHRDTFFRGLRKIHANDTITVTTLDGFYRYRVESIQVVGPDDTWVLRASKQPTLTLVTCYPFYFVGAAPERFVVQAKQILS